MVGRLMGTRRPVLPGRRALGRPDGGLVPCPADSLSPVSATPRPLDPAESDRAGLSPEAIQAIAELWAEILLADLERHPPLVE